MARPGTKPKARAIKALEGTERPDRALDNAIEFPRASNDEGVPPNWLTDFDALEIWHRMYPHLTMNGVFTVGDYDAFCDMCWLKGDMVGKVRAKKQVPISYYNTIRHFYELFGMTPSSRTRIARSGKPAERNKFTGRGRKAS